MLPQVVQEAFTGLGVDVVEIALGEYFPAESTGEELSTVDVLLVLHKVVPVGEVDTFRVILRRALPAPEADLWR